MAAVSVHVAGSDFRQIWFFKLTLFTNCGRPSLEKGLLGIIQISNAFLCIIFLGDIPVVIIQNSYV
jgi:hypothetical protein